MRILVDENIPGMTVQALRDGGHEVLDVRGSETEGAADSSLWEAAQREGRLVITTDKGFLERRQEAHHGLLVVRLRQPNRDKIHRRVMLALSQFTEREWVNLSVTMRDVSRSVWRGRVRG